MKGAACGMRGEGHAGGLPRAKHERSSSTSFGLSSSLPSELESLTAALDSLTWSDDDQ